MLRADLVVDVTDSCCLDRPTHIVATAFLPAPGRLRAGQTVVFALPRGGYSRGYYDMHFPDHAGYSQAEHLLDHGFVLVTLDHLGVGESSPEVADLVRIDDIAAANDFAVRTITDRLRSGSAVPGYPPIDVGAHTGIGQSMGGGVTVIMCTAVAPKGAQGHRRESMLDSDRAVGPVYRARCETGLQVEEMAEGRGIEAEMVLDD